MLLDDEAEKALRVQAKIALRKRMRALRNAIPESARAERSARIVESIARSDAFAGARSIALFWPMLERNEVDLRPLDALARRLGKRVAYPALRGDPPATAFVWVDRPDAIEPQGRGFPEPPDDAPIVESGEGLLAIVAALAIDARGHRIGYGRGFYDDLLAKVAPPAVTMAVAYDFQLIVEVPESPRDRAVDLVVTDARSFAAESGRAANA